MLGLGGGWLSFNNFLLLKMVQEPSISN